MILQQQNNQLKISGFYFFYAFLALSGLLVLLNSFVVSWFLMIVLTTTFFVQLCYTYFNCWLLVVVVECGFVVISY